MFWMEFVGREYQNLTNVKDLLLVDFVQRCQTFAHIIALDELLVLHLEQAITVRKIKCQQLILSRLVDFEDSRCSKQRRLAKHTQRLSPTAGKGAPLCQRVAISTGVVETWGVVKDGCAARAWCCRLSSREELAEKG